MKLFSRSALLGVIGLLGFSLSISAEETGSADSEVFELPWSTFRALQSAHIRGGSSSWPKGSARRIQSELWADGEISELEQTVLDQLLQDSFSFIIKSRPSPGASARELHLKASLTPAGRELLEPQRSEESRVAYLFRQEWAGLEKLAALISWDEEAFLEGSHLVTGQILTTFEEGESALRKLFSLYQSRMERLKGKEAEVYQLWIRVAASRAYAKEFSLGLRPAAAFFENPETIYTEAREINQALRED